MQLWKKILIGLGVAGFALLGTIGGILFVTFKDNAPLVDGREVGPATTVVDGGFVAAYWLDAGDGRLILVDASNSSDGQELLDALAQAGHEPADVGYILLTHGHPDHTAALDVFPDATVYAHANDTNLVGADRLDEALADGDALTIGTRDVRVFHVPGHTAGSVAYLIDSTLFMGDAASATKTGGMQTTPWVFSEDTAQASRSLVALSERLTQEGYDVEEIAFGHSDKIEGLEPLADLADRLRGES